MTLWEKLQFVVLFGARGIENTNTGIPSLCIPPLTLSDGPNGISNETPGSLQLPAAIGLAASFDPHLAAEVGKVLGAEAYTKGIDVQQAPELNLARVPVSGRIFEAFGEDPYLTSVMGVAEAANPNTVVVLNTGGAVLLPWARSVRSILEAWYPGQVDGTATAAVLDGSVDPSGRLPLTFPAAGVETPVAARPSLYPGRDGTVTYANGLLVGYRWYLAHHLRPRFPFGYGLSYTRFRLGTVRMRLAGRALLVRVQVRNVGRRAGRVVVQAYLAFPPSADEPPEQLSAVASVELRPRRSGTVRLWLRRRSFEAYLRGRFRTVAGSYRLGIGFDVTDLPIHLRVRPPRR